MKKITHLVLSGGGIKGACYIGIFRYLYIENLNKDIKNIAGTSIGALMALIFALQIPIDVIEDLFKKSLNNYIISTSQISNIFVENGIFNSIDFLKDIKDYIKERFKKEDLTFLELSKKTGVNLYISCTNILKNKNKIFDLENTPNISVLDAVSASITIPFLMKPVLIEKEYYIDGFFTNNYPIDVFLNNNVQKDNILGIVLYVDYIYNNIKEDDILDFTIYKYVFQLINLLSVSFSKYTTNITNEADNIIIDEKDLKIKYLSFDYIDNNLILSIDKNEIDEAIVKGFEIFDIYYKKNYLIFP